MGCCLLLAVMAVTYVLTRTKPVYLMNYFCYKAPDRSVSMLLGDIDSQAVPKWLCLCHILNNNAADMHHLFRHEHTKLSALRCINLDCSVKASKINANVSAA